MLAQLSQVVPILSQGSAPDISVSVIAPDKVGECLQSNFTVSLENVGSENATSVIVNVTMPGGLAYTPGTGSVNGTRSEPVIAGGSISWNLSSLGFDPIRPRDRLRIEFNLTADCRSPESPSITVLVSYEDENGTSYSSSDTSDPFQVLRPALIVEKIPATQEAEVGDVVQWTIKVKNTGFSKALNVTLVDELGSSLDYLSADPEPDGFTPDGRAYWTNISLAVGEAFEVTLSALVEGCEGLVDNASAYVTCRGR